MYIFPPSYAFCKMTPRVTLAAAGLVPVIASEQTEGFSAENNQSKCTGTHFAAVSTCT